MKKLADQKNLVATLLNLNNLENHYVNLCLQGEDGEYRGREERLKRCATSQSDCSRPTTSTSGCARSAIASSACWSRATLKSPSSLIITEKKCVSQTSL